MIWDLEKIRRLIFKIKLKLVLRVRNFKIILQIRGFVCEIHLRILSVRASSKRAVMQGVHCRFPWGGQDLVRRNEHLRETVRWLLFIRVRKLGGMSRSFGDTFSKTNTCSGEKSRPEHREQPENHGSKCAQSTRCAIDEVGCEFCRMPLNFIVFSRLKIVAFGFRSIRPDTFIDRAWKATSPIMAMTIWQSWACTLIRWEVSYSSTH